VMEKGQAIFGVVNPFLLVVKILDAVLFTNFTGIVGRRAE